jgi:exopolyphosphatase/guanosine-5'-triphosphate,3'-diphosphate pyrophosphatase
VRDGADEVIAIATSALRDSPDRDDLGALLSDALELPVTFIDGREEARLTLAGVQASVALEPRRALLLDLGGGSLEVVLADGGGLRWGESLPVGAGRLTGMLVGSDPPTRAERRAVRAAVASAVAPVAETLGEPIVRAVASGGTAGALARLIATERWTDPPPSLNGYEIDVAVLKDVTDRIAGLSLAQRLRLPGIDERRAELLPAGGWILLAAAAALGIETFIHSEWGLREGVVFDALGLADRPAPKPEDLRGASVDALVGAWGGDGRHLRLIERLAAELFDALADLHGLDDGDRELLEHAASLHEVGNAISPARFHKHGAYLVENGGMRGFDPGSLAAVASLVRFQRGKDPRPVFQPFTHLSDRRRDAVTSMAAILRLAHAIGRGDEPEDLGLEIRVRPRSVRLRVRGSTHPDAVAAEAADAGALFERVFGRSVEVETADEPSPSG